MSDRGFRTALRCRLASADTADIRGQAGDAEPEPCLIFQPFPNAFHALSSLKGGIDFRPECLDLTGFGSGLFRTAQRETGAHAGDPVVRVFCFVCAGQKIPPKYYGPARGRSGRANTTSCSLARAEESPLNNQGNSERPSGRLNDLSLVRLPRGKFGIYVNKGLARGKTELSI